MRGRRIAAAVLLLGVLAGTLFDRCLVACGHETAGASSTAACHHDTASDAVTIHGAGLCDHDHQSLLADERTDGRVRTRDGFGLALVPVPSTEPSSLTSVGEFEARHNPQFALTPVEPHRQLRL